MRIEEVKRFPPKVVAALMALYEHVAPGRVNLETVQFGLIRQGVTVFAAYDRDRMVGCITLVRHPDISGWVGRIETLVVEPAWRNQGIGQQLVERAIETAKRAKVTAVYVTFDDSQIPPHALYLRFGFGPHDVSYKLDLQPAMNRLSSMSAN